MNSLSEQDMELIERATNVIKRNYDNIKYNHTVGAAVRCKNGNIYTGVNVYSVHGACAEIIAIGAAISAGEREFECIVAIGGDNLDLIYSPCGNCRQFILEYAPKCFVIISAENGLCKMKIEDLIPHAYHRAE
jgi:cytidine deaminase